MKAVLCKAYGPPESLVVEDVEPLKAGKGQVVVSVKACGVNFPDTLIIQGKYQFKPAMPFSPGGEIAGVVKEIGEGVERVNIG
ncbi:MAG TPA: alcohol dehydrogenase catalytic domain-containing protein, partial [Ktedonobacteraceae bacterium]|nr:alcohol dehydrogenase catalytic domain-containing protein [Ktedonobacteraceae bacterium]